MRSYLGNVSTNGDETLLQGTEEHERLEQALLPHLDAACNLARWLTGDDHDAEDLVQGAYLRALKFFGGFHGTNSRAWLLRIVRNVCYTWRDQKRAGRSDGATGKFVYPRGMPEGQGKIRH